MNWNIEWMNNWFVGNGRVEWRQSHTGIVDVQALAQRIVHGKQEFAEMSFNRLIYTGVI